MIKNYLKTAWRNLVRNKSYTLIHITGLAVGIAVCFIMFLIIRFELSFDGFHRNADGIYRIISEQKNEDQSWRTAGVPYPVPTTLHHDFPSLKTTAVYSEENEQIQITEGTDGRTTGKFLEETGVFFAEPSFFEIFNFPLLAGDYKTLNNPNNALLTKETADRYFGDWRSAIGKTFKRNNHQDFTVTGILASVPLNTDFQIRVVASYSTLKNFTGSSDWVSVASNHSCYLLLPDGVKKDVLDSQLNEFILKYRKNDQDKYKASLQPLSEVHYDDEPGNFLRRTISKNLINSLWLIAGFILLIACVNFINLSTAQAANRAKEVGVRKVLGGNNRQLAFQFFSETSLITLAATIVAVLLAYITLPALQPLLNIPINHSKSDLFSLLLFTAVIVTLVILLAGFYPALVLSRFSPVRAFSKRISAGKPAGVLLRRGLVVLQFVIAQGLIIGTLITIKQMDYFSSRSMGFDSSAVVNVSLPADSVSITKQDYLKKNLLDIPGISAMSYSFESPASTGVWSSNFRYNGAEKETGWDTQLKWADADFITTYSVPLVAGRNMKPSDTARECLVNEAFVKRLGLQYSAEALEKDISLWNGYINARIVGVTRDFHAESFHKTIQPVLMTTVKNFYTTAGIRIRSDQIPAALKKVDEIWNRVYPEFVFNPVFLDTRIGNFYAQEKRLSGLYKIFAVIAIFLSCLGLYGLASFLTTQKLKEIGIRKVLGASVKDILVLYYREFVLLICIAFVIAAPIAWYFMYDWLQDFAYRVSVGWQVFALAALLAFLVAFVSISFQTIRSSLASPVKALRTE